MSWTSRNPPVAPTTTELFQQFHALPLARQRLNGLKHDFLVMARSLYEDGNDPSYVLFDLIELLEDMQVEQERMAKVHCQLQDLVIQRLGGLTPEELKIKGETK
jgi:hypothetical protein